MRKAFKWIIGISGVLIAIALIAAGIGYAFLMRTLPADNAIGQIPGLTGQVQVVRDKHAVPHIVGDSLLDVVATQGYVHAQERLWQMETFRMAGEGRLSQVFGEATVDSDKFLRTLNLDGYSKASFEALDPQTREILQAYARGVNAYINREKRMFEPALPPEFMILGHTPQPWEAWHSVMTVKVMALTLGSNLGKEIQRLALASKGFSSREIDDLVPYHSKDNPPPLEDLRKLYGFPASGKIQKSDVTNDALKEIKSANLNALAWPIGVTASNNWVVAGSRTNSGKVLLANDPHLGLTAPSIWYLSHLSWKTDGKQVNLIGASMPSIPLVMLGRNDRVAWGFTTSVLDSQDIFIERLNPDNSDEYLTENGYAKFSKRDVIIKVSGKPDVELTIKSTRNGPVLPAKFRNISTYLPDGHVAALKWLALTDDDTSMDALTGFATANSVDELMQTTRKLVSPMQSIVIGDVDGNIGFIAPSRVAVRSPENKIMGRAPVLGWLPEYAWQDYLPFDDLPHAMNPDNGVLFSANSKFVADDYPHHLTFDWAEEFRHERVKGLISDSNSKHNMASMKAAQADIYSPAMHQLRDELLGQMPGGLSKDADIVAMLQNWDGKMRKDGQAPLVMVAWFKTLYENLLKDDLGDEFELFDRGYATQLLTLINGNGARDWCDDKKAPGVQTCGEIILTSFRETVRSLESTYGKNWKDWRWGSAHKAYGQHRPFAKVPPLDQIFNVEVESAGGPYTLLRGQTDFGEENPYLSRHASSYRAIYDFSDLDQSTYIQTTGQSGNFLSKHFRDLAPIWSDSGYISISSKPSDFKSDAIGVWNFVRKN